MIFSSSFPGTSSSEIGRFDVTRCLGVSGLCISIMWQCLNFFGKCPVASDMLKIAVSLRVMLGVVCARMALFICEGPGVLGLVSLMAQSVSSNVIGAMSGLFASSAVRSIVGVGLVRCMCCCMCALTMCSVFASNWALSCGVIWNTCVQCRLCSSSISSFVSSLSLFALSM